jgi:hypothetical protein
MKKLLVTLMLTAFCWTAFASNVQAQDTTGRQQDTTKKHDKKTKKKKSDTRDTTNRKPGDTTSRTAKPM